MKPDLPAADKEKFDHQGCVGDNGVQNSRRRAGAGQVNL